MLFFFVLMLNHRVLHVLQQSPWILIADAKIEYSSMRTELHECIKEVTLTFLTAVSTRRPRRKQNRTTDEIWDLLSQLFWKNLWNHISSSNCSVLPVKALVIRLNSLQLLIYRGILCLFLFISWNAVSFTPSMFISFCFPLHTYSTWYNWYLSRESKLFRVTRRPGLKHLRSLECT